MSRPARRLFERLRSAFNTNPATIADGRFTPAVHQLESRDVPSAPAPPPGYTATPASFSNATPVAISNGAASVVTSTITVSGAGTYLHDVDLTTFIQHTFASDLDITLTSPAGTVVTITTDNGGGNDNVYNGTLWDDDADPSSTLPYANSANTVADTLYTNNVVKPTLTPEEALGAFIGENPNGVWTLTISDDATGDGGSLDSWKLDLSTLNANAGLTGPQVFSNTTAVAISTGAASVVTSTITVSGATTYVQKLTFETFIQHTFASDLDITLTSPAGTVVTITTDNGGGNDNVYNGTLWDDDADPSSTLPYANSANTVADTLYTNNVVKPTLTPEEALGAFIGENPNGVWTLTISDDATGDGGSLDSWKLNIFAALAASGSPPVVVAPATLSVVEDSTANPVAGVSVTDPNSGDTVTVTVTAAAGTVAATGAGVSNSGTAVMTITGTPSAVTTALGTLTYSPTANFFGATTIIVAAVDSTGSVGTPRTINVTVSAVNDVPTAGNDALPGPFAEDNAVTVPFSTLLGNDNGGPGETAQTLTINLGTATGGTVAIVGTNVVFTPTANLNGPASFTYTVTDNGLTNGAADPKTSAPATVSFTLTEVNDAPTVGNDTIASILANSGPSTISGGMLLANDSRGPANESAQTLTITNVAVTTGSGTAALVAGNVVFTPALNFLGPVRLTYTITDNGTTNGTPDPKTGTGTIDFIVTPGVPPVITSDGGGPTAAITIPENSTAVTTVSVIDTDIPAQTFTFTLSGPDAARFSITAGGVLRFATAPDFELPSDAGADNVYNVTVTVTDSSPAAFTDSQAIAVTVTDLADKPPSVPLPVTVASGQFIAIGTDAGTLGTVRVLDATTRTPVRDFVPFEGFSGGVRVALGDVNGDGRDDVIVGTATGTSHVKVFDVATGAELQSFIAFPFFGGGVTLAAGDIDGDGKADVVVGTATQSAHVKAFSGATGGEILSLIAFEGFTGGVKVAAGDVTGDGKADIAVLAGTGGNGHIKVFDGVTGALATSFFGYAGYLGEINIAIGDADGNGRGDVITVAQNAAGDTHFKAFDAAAATVRSFLAPIARSTDFLRTPNLPPPVPGTVARVGVADVTGDQIADYLLGSQAGAGFSRLVLINGATGASTTDFAFGPSFGFGVYVDLS